MIYLDNAATTLKKPPEVAAAVVKAMETMGNADRGSHGGALAAARPVYACREALKELFHAPGAERVVFTQNATEALNIAISGTLVPGDHVVTTDLEHNSVLRPLYRLEAERGVKLSFAAPDACGHVSPSAIEALIRPDTRAIICTHASNLTGEVIDIEAVGRIAKARDLLFIVDASQTAGALPIDMERMGIGILCFTGHKGLMGPQGTGGLCIGEGVEIRPFKTGGSGIHSFSKTQPEAYPTRLEAGTLNGHGIAGLGAAVDHILKTGVDAIGQREEMLMRRFYEGVSGIEGVTVYGDFSGRRRAAIVALNIRDMDSAEVSDILSEAYGIATRPGVHCAPRMHEALGTREQGAVRFSFSYYNTEAEADAAVNAVKELAEG